MTTVSKNQSRASARPVRKRVGASNRLKFDNLDTENYFHYIVNDSGTDIAEHQEAGYEIVDPSEGGMQRERIEGGVAADKSISLGGGMRGYIMRQPMEFRKEDLAAKAAEVDAQVGAVKSPGLEGQTGSVTIT